ncbi:cryptochrome/photolyase family protein [Kangiella sp. HZ709]|uniref:cryptochrome/photolyase family protein n=1 Tax=Kangiella sp. HZ709 TaxID=2666328 RepID=UPI0012AFE46C|nr:cryptochrome/photolyase family protein [Kangiella sp. HZ709]MRX26823.1 cryptochrome/photolyase family protein [Kangiella sp. HZ709]
MIYKTLDQVQSNFTTLRLILGDQLNAKHTWYRNDHDSILYVIAELPQEINYVQHHIQKICSFFAAIDQFAHAISLSGHHVLYLNLDETCQYQSLTELLTTIAKKTKVKTFEYQLPDEFRLKSQLAKLNIGNDIKITPYDSEHFYLHHYEFEQYIKPQKHNRLETFYRKLRKRFNILMDKEGPSGGQWNFDKANRNKLKPFDLNGLPKPKVFTNNITEYKKRLDRHGFSYFGNISEAVLWPVNRKQAMQVLDYFCKHCLPQFGKFQDAMTENSEYAWSLFHSRLSFALNAKMISPRMVIKKALSAYHANDAIDLAQIEGFIRQILGWREYVRAVYWQNMPEYSQMNFLNTKRKLPKYFWTAKTQMNCMQKAIQQSLDYSYAHHIQRLMITGNFALLTGINIKEIEQWYLGIYIDAIEWVELPNTLGMSQFADAGLIATKPYAASGNYINNMSDYCKSCHYSVKEKETNIACPFNSFYWYFLAMNKEQLGKLPRLSLAYRNWNNKTDLEQDALIKRAEYLLENIESL